MAVKIPLKAIWVSCVPREVQHKEVHSPAPAPVHAGDWAAGKQVCRKGPVVLIDSKLTASQKCVFEAKKTDGTLGCIRGGVLRADGGDAVPLYLAVVRHAWKGKRDAEIPGIAQQKAVKMMKGLRHLSYEERQGWGLEETRGREVWSVSINT